MILGWFAVFQWTAGVGGGNIPVSDINNNQVCVSRQGLEQ